MGRPGRRRTWATVLAAPLLLLTGCSEDDADRAVDQAREAASSAMDEVDLPEVDWDRYGEELQDELDRAAEEADCELLRESLNRYESTSNEVTDYIEAKLEEAGC